MQSQSQAPLHRPRWPSSRVNGTDHGTVERRRGELLVGGMMVALPEDEPPEIVVQARGGGLFQADLVARSSGYGKGSARSSSGRGSRCGSDNLWHLVADVVVW